MTDNGFGIIFLVGFMGSGKTTLGKKLAAKLQYPFIDLDHVLENQVGSTIAQYFAAHGEASFRELESSVLKNKEYPVNAVVSTGGGLPCFFDNMEWMNQHGQTVYLKLTPAALASRLANNRDERPVLQGKHGDELVAFIAEKLNQRQFFYGQAKFIAEGLSLTPDDVIKLLEV